MSYGLIKFNGALVKNSITESKYYLSAGISHRASPTMYGLGSVKLSHDIAKRWRIDETRARMGSDTLSS